MLRDKQVADLFLRAGCIRLPFIPPKLHRIMSRQRKGCCGFAGIARHAKSMQTRRSSTLTLRMRARCKKHSNFQVKHLIKIKTCFPAADWDILDKSKLSKETWEWWCFGCWRSSSPLPATNSCITRAEHAGDCWCQIQSVQRPHQSKSCWRVVGTTAWNYSSPKNLSWWMWLNDSFQVAFEPRLKRCELCLARDFPRLCRIPWDFSVHDIHDIHYIHVLGLWEILSCPISSPCTLDSSWGGCSYSSHKLTRQE